MAIPILLACTLPAARSQRLEVRLPADRDQQVAAADPPAIVEHQRGSGLDGAHGRALQQRDATRNEAARESGNQFGVLPTGDRRGLDDGDATAQADERVGHLQADRSAA